MSCLLGTGGIVPSGYNSSFPRQDTFKLSLLCLKKRSIIGQWTAIKRKGPSVPGNAYDVFPASTVTLRVQVTAVETAPSSALDNQPDERKQHHLLPEEPLPRWRATILGGRHLEATGMTFVLRTTLCEPTCLVFKEKHKNN